MATEIVTLEELSLYYTDKSADESNGLSTDSREDTIRIGINYLIEQACDRDFSADSSDRNEAHRIEYDYTRTIQLKKPPVVSFTSLQTGEAGDNLSTIDSTSYEYDSDTGIIKAIRTPFLTSIRYVANYKGGYSTIPGDLKLAAKSIMAREIAKTAKGRHGMRGRAVQATSVELFLSDLEPFEAAIIEGYTLKLA